MSEFIQHNGAFWSIQGHVIMIKTYDLVALQRKAATFEMPWAFSDEGDGYQFAHPMNDKERAEHAWLYHRMDGLRKAQEEVDTDPEPPYTPGPLVA